jgi:hypothetical protein
MQDAAPDEEGKRGQSGAAVKLDWIEILDVAARAIAHQDIANAINHEYANTPWFSRINVLTGYK